MDIGDLEVVTTWHEHHNVVEVIDAWRGAYAQEQQSLGAYIGKMTRNENLPWRNPYLTETVDAFFAREIISDSDRDDEAGKDVE